MKLPQFWATVCLMALAAVLLVVRGDKDRVPPSVPLNQMPIIIGGWGGVDLPLDSEVLQVLGKGVFLNRVYQPLDAPAASASADSIGLFIGYFPTQRTGQSIHSPQNCLPGSGWTFVSSGTTELAGYDGKRYQVGEYLISDGTNKDEVLYWYRSRGRNITSDYKAKFYTLVDSIRYNRTDAALVRLVSPVKTGETQAQAHDRIVKFAEQVSPLLPAYIPD